MVPGAKGLRSCDYWVCVTSPRSHLLNTRPSKQVQGASTGLACMAHIGYTDPPLPQTTVGGGPPPAFSELTERLRGLLEALGILFPEPAQQWAGVLGVPAGRRLPLRSPGLTRPFTSLAFQGVSLRAGAAGASGEKRDKQGHDLGCGPTFLLTGQSWVH